MADNENPIDAMMEIDDEPKTRKEWAKQADQLEKLVLAIDSEIGNAYSYSASSLYYQMGEAWRRFYQLPFNIDGEADYSNSSNYVSGMLTKHVNQVRAFILNRYQTSAPIIRFTPEGASDVKAADAATDYVNHVFRTKLNGTTFIDQTVFNAALLKMCPVRVYVKNKPQELVEYEYSFEGTEEDFYDDYAAFEANEDNQSFVTSPPVEQVTEEIESATTIDPATGQEVEVTDAQVQANPEMPVKPATIKTHMKWRLDLPDDKEVAIDIISPGSFFVSRQADSLEDARMVAQLARYRVSELKDNYPDAHKRYGYKDKDQMQFWAELQSEYVEWFRETEWLEKWAKDTLGLSEIDDGVDQNDEAGVGAKQIFVMDAEIWYDEDNSGTAKLCHVIKAGRYVIYKEEIESHSFINGSLIPTGNKWVGLSINDLIDQDLRSESTLVRAFVTSAAEAANPHALIDLSQVEQKDITDLQPGSVIRRKAGAPQTGVSAVEWTKPPGPDPSVLQGIEMLRASASTLTGAGQGFQGANAETATSSRLGEQAAKMINNNSMLMMQYFKGRYDDFLCQVLVKIWKTAVKGGVSPDTYYSREEWKEFDPKQQKVRENFIINPILGQDEKLEQITKAQAILATLQQPIPGVQLLPNAGYQAVKMLLEANDIPDVDNWLVNPTTQQQISQDPQVVAFLENAQAMMAQQSQQMVQQAVQEALQMPAAQKDLAKAKLDDAKATEVVDGLEHQMDKDAMAAAISQDREEKIDDRSVMKSAIDLERFELSKEEFEFEKDLATKQFEEGMASNNIDFSK